MTYLLQSDLTSADRLALLWFLVAWLGYGAALQRAPSWMPSINTRMDEIRRAWMRTMLSRDNRITDASLIGHTVHSATFFASTTMIAIAGLLGMLGAFDRSFAGLSSLDFTANTSRTVAEIKLLLLLLVFAHTFLKLSWALRQLNYCLALIGASPQKPGAAERERIAGPVAAVLSLAVRCFNAGVRGYLFALAALAWLLGPMAFMTATTGMVAILLWRQFGSLTARSIAASHAALLGVPASDLTERMPATAAPAGA